MDTIEGFHYVNFGSNTRLAPILMVISQNLLGQENVITNTTTTNESRLRSINDIRKDILESIGQDLGDTFIYRITTCNGTEVRHFGSIQDLGNQGNRGGIQLLEKTTRSKEILNSNSN